MRLVVDVGNTRIKWRFAAQEGHVVHVHPGWEAALSEGCVGWGAPTSIVLGSVAGEGINQALQAVFERLWPGVALQWLRSRAQVCGVRIQYAETERFGIDRLAALVAAHHAFIDTPLLLVDAGTAMTLDVLDATGLHRGGMIMPGRRLIYVSLAGGAANLAMTDFAPDRGRLGFAHATDSAIHAGVRAMLLGGMRSALDEAKQMLGAQPELVLTGGDAALLLSDQPAGQAGMTHVRESLVLDGLALMAHEILG